MGLDEIAQGARAEKGGKLIKGKTTGEQLK